MKKLNLFYVLAAGFLVVSGSVFAAEPIILNDLNGEVMITQDGSNAPGAKGMNLFDGNRVMVVEGATAQLKWPNGCIYDVIGEFLVNITHEAPCKAGVLVASTAAAPAASAGKTALALGGLGVALALLLDDDNDTISP